MKHTRPFLSRMVLLLGLAIAVPAPAAVLVNTNAFWKYWKGNSEASTVPDTHAWRSNSFNDAGWITTAAPFWYDTTGDSSTLPGGTQLTDMINTYTCIFLRQSFTLTNVAEISGLRLGALCDDGFIVWINGVEVYRYNMPAGEPIVGTFFATGAAAEPVPYTLYDLTAPAPSSYLLVGANTIAIQVFNATLASSDLDFDASLTSFILDPTPPTVMTVTPAPGTRTNLTQITVQFSEPVTGIGPADLLVNGQPANSVTGAGDTYTFVFNPPAYGTVQISWDVGHGITDLALPANPFNATGPGATWQYTLEDTTPPAVSSVNPTPGFTVTSLIAIEVLFTEAVSGVNAGDLLVNGVPATNVSVVTPSQYVFQFAQPANGTVQISWTNTHGIQDLAAAPNPFPGGGWSYVLDPNAGTTLVVISEFMAFNDNGLRDEDGDKSDWIEVYNAGALTVNLSNWFLTDDSANLAKWQFPSTNLAPNAYLLVWASEKNKRVPGAPLHTNFKLEGAGEYLGLVRSNIVGGLEIVWEYRAKFPTQQPNISYGVAMNVGPYTTLIPTGATARVLVPSGDLGLTWTDPAFNDTGWSSATTGIGFDTGTNYDPGISTDIQAQMQNVNASAFIRIPFTVASPATIQDLRLRLRYDDGFVAYINGVEAMRRNAPAAPTWNSSATASHGSDPGGGTPLQANFDNLNPAMVLSQYSAAPGPSVLAANAGSTGSFLRLLTDVVNNNINGVTFAQTAPGLFQAITADFDFRITDTAANPADGFAFLLIPTANYGTTGAGIAIPAGIEEPNFANIFAIGFDLYPHASQNDVSAHWNGTELMNTTIPRGTIEMVSGTFHHCSMSLRHADGGGYVTVIITPNVNSVPGTPYTAVNNLYIPGLNPYDSRVQFGGRTGGADMSVDLDNLNVQFGFPSGMVPSEEFNISSSINALVPGANVLAIHALNRAANDADFLITPELVGRSVSVQTNFLHYFATPTPGAANEGGVPGVAADPAFSMPGGVYTNASLSIALSTATPGASIRYTIDGSTPTAGSALYTNTLTVANSTVVKAVVFAPGLLPSRIVVQTYTILDPSLYNFTSNLPLVIIDSFGQAIPDGTKIPASMVFIDTYRGRSSLRGTPDAQVRAGIEIRGSSSTQFPKKSWGFETRDENTNDFAVSLLGMPAESDWVLYAPYTDKTFMNDYLSYELWDAMGHYAVRRKFVEVFQDATGGKLVYPGDYVGIYVLLEKIKVDKDRVDIPKLDGGDNLEPDVSGGYILKRDRFDGNEYTFNVRIDTGAGTSIMGVESPKGGDITTAQKNWLNSWFGQLAAALYGANYTNPVTGYAAYIDVGSFIDHYWIVEMPKNIDGYRLSNFYYKDRNGKLKEGPIWDWNLSFGNANYLDGGKTNLYYAPNVGDADYFYYRRLFSDPDFYQKHIDRWAALRTNLFATTNLIGRVEAITNLLNEAQARDFAKWPRLGIYVWPNPGGGAADATTSDINYTAPTTFSALFGQVKFWINGRLTWLDQQFTRPPAFSQYGGPVSAGTVVSISAPAGTIYYTLDGTDPRGPGGNLAPGVLTYAGPLTIANNTGLFARARVGTGANSWSGPTLATYVIETPKLLVTEIMYHPDPAPPDSMYGDEDFEYIEIKNHGATPINLLHSRIRGGVDVELPNYLLQPGCYVVVVAQTNAFRARYGSIPVIVGSFTDRLENDGGHIIFEGPVREPIHDFTYSDGWDEITDGFGFSLVPVNENTPLANWGYSSSWRASAALRGSPGTNDAVIAVLPQVVINEALTRTGLSQVVAVELRNLSGVVADISHWYLTDDFGRPQKYRFPPGTTLPAGGYRLVYETNFNAGSNAFTLRSLGDEVYLYSGDAAGNLTGYHHGFDYGPQFSGVTFGRYLTSQGADHFVAQVSSSLGSANSAPLVGPLVISEINYHPPDVANAYGVWDNPDDEFIELHNISGAVVPLYHPTNSAIVWKLRDAVDFSFPPGTMLPAGGFALVVGFNPADTAALNAFIANNGIPGGIPIYGPWSGKLDNSSDSVELVVPDNPVDGEVPYVIADKVRYSHDTPWPPAADGIGATLQRLVESSYGNDPSNWTAAARSPGASFIGGGSVPGVTSQPQNRIVAATTATSFSLVATGAPPLTYQWRFRASGSSSSPSQLPGSTNSLLVLNYVTTGQAGTYDCIVLNPYGSTVSSNATLTVLVPATISQHPTNIEVRVKPDPSPDALPSTNASFTVAASTANPPLSYQWRVNGTNLPPSPRYAGLNATTLTVSNVTIADYGQYSCAITDGAATIVSSNAFLYPLVRPSILIPPATQTVPALSAVPASLVLSNGFPPPYYYYWYRGSSVFATNISDSKTNFTIIPSLIVSNFASQAYTVRVTNRAATVFIQSNTANFTLFTTADTDLDGMPDSYELTYGGSTTGFVPGLDADGDGMSNLAEYLAGTDPSDPNSYLKINQTIMPGVAAVNFGAIANRTYTVQYSDVISPASWQKLADIASRPSNRTELLVDPAWSSNRFYRVVTPRQP